MSEEPGIYFCGSIRAGRSDVDLYGRICEKLSVYGKVFHCFKLEVFLFKKLSFRY